MLVVFSNNYINWQYSQDTHLGMLLVAKEIGSWRTMSPLFWMIGQSARLIQEFTIEMLGKKLEYPTSDVLRKHGQLKQTTRLYNPKM